MNLTTKITAAITGTIILALTGAIFYVAGQNSELREELSQKNVQLTNSEKQVKTLTSIVDQAHDRIHDLNTEAEYDAITARLKQQRLAADLDFCEIHKDYIFRHYAPKRVQRNMRNAMLVTDGL